MSPDSTQWCVSVYSMANILHYTVYTSQHASPPTSKPTFPMVSSQTAIVRHVKYHVIPTYSLRIHSTWNEKTPETRDVNGSHQAQSFLKHWSIFPCNDHHCHIPTYIWAYICIPNKGIIPLCWHSIFSFPLAIDTVFLPKMADIGALFLRMTTDTITFYH